jgi:hypothetical protein
MGNEGLQTAAEGKSRRYHRHGKDGSQHRRTHGYCGSSFAWLKRQTHPYGARCR